MNKELQKKAEDFIIERYKIAKCYREDNAETREYMRMDVHSQYEEEYQLYLDATKELQKENAELKKLKRECETSLCRAEYQYNYDQLTKAKELLRKILSEVKDEPQNYITSTTIAEAEQFLNSEGK